MWTISMRHDMIWKEMPDVCCAAVPGAPVRGTPASPTAATAIPPPSSPASACESSWPLSCSGFLIPVFWNQYGDEIQISMKTYKNLYTRIWAYENLYEAWCKAARGKR